MNSVDKSTVIAIIISVVLTALIILAIIMFSLFNYSSYTEASNSTTPSSSTSYENGTSAYAFFKKLDEPVEIYNDDVLTVTLTGFGLGDSIKESDTRVGLTITNKTDEQIKVVETELSDNNYKLDGKPLIDAYIPSEDAVAELRGFTNNTDSNVISPNSDGNFEFYFTGKVLEGKRGLYGMGSVITATINTHYNGFSLKSNDIPLEIDMNNSYFKSSDFKR